MANGTNSDAYAHLNKLDEAVTAHNLSDALKNENVIQSGFSAGARGRDPMAGESDTKSILNRKKEIVEGLKKELLFLGLKEGNTTECVDPQLNSSNTADCRGILRKRIKSGLIMEYTFSTTKQTILNFNLNNVNIDLLDMPEDKLVKLLIIIKFFNSVYRLKENNGENDMKNEEEPENIKKEKKENNKRKLVLGKL